MATLRIALAQINPTVGDVRSNTEKVVDYLRRSRDCHAGIVLFPELTLTGYPPEDLLLKPGFAGASRAARSRLTESGSWSGISAAGVPWRGLNGKTCSFENPASRTASHVA